MPLQIAGGVKLLLNTAVWVTLKVAFIANTAGQFGVALVMVIPVICNVWVLLAAVNAIVLKLAVVPVATTPVAVCVGPPAIV